MCVGFGFVVIHAVFIYEPVTATFLAWLVIVSADAITRPAIAVMIAFAVAHHAIFQLFSTYGHVLIPFA